MVRAGARVAAPHSVRAILLLVGPAAAVGVAPWRGVFRLRPRPRQERWWAASANPAVRLWLDRGLREQRPRMASFTLELSPAPMAPSRAAATTCECRPDANAVESGVKPARRRVIIT